MRMRLRFLLPPLLLVPVVSWLAAGEPAFDAARPIGVASVGESLLVGVRGGLVRIDPKSRTVVDKIRLGTNVVAMAVHGDRIALLDGDVLVTVDAKSTRENGRRKVGLSACDVALPPNRSFASVACLWPRQLQFVDELGGAIVKLDLPFAPKKQIVSPDGRLLVVADAFAGKIALVDLDRKTLLSVRALPDVHNIRGLAWSRDGRWLWLTHQNLHKHGHTTSTDIRAGSVVSNHLRKLAATSVLDPAVEIFRDEIVYTLGDIEQGAGDPADVAELADGRLVVSLAGIAEVAIGQPERVLWNRVSVGRSPEALAVVGARVFVAEKFDDAIAAIDLVTAKVERIRLTTSDRPLTSVERGEIAFFDARHSLEGWYSCHSCHSYGHTSGRLNDNFTDGSFGTPKRVLTLRGVADTGPWAWNGQMKTLEEQTRNSIRSTMAGIEVAEAGAGRRPRGVSQESAASPRRANGPRRVRSGQGETRPEDLRPREMQLVPHAADLHVAEGVRCRPDRRGRRQALQSAVAARGQPGGPALPRRPGPGARRRVREAPPRVAAAAGAGRACRPRTLSSGIVSCRLIQVETRSARCADSRFSCRLP